MQQYNVTGMSCAACSARVERAVKKVPGVTSCSVNLLTGTMAVEGEAEEKEIVQAVKKAGYGAEIKTDQKKIKTADAEEKNTNSMKKYLCISIVFLVLLMYLSMGHMMWGFPLPAWLTYNYVAQGICQLIFTMLILFINRAFFFRGFLGLCRRSPNMDTLVALGAGASFIYSLVVLFRMTDAMMNDNMQQVMTGAHDLYFESAAMIVTLISVGKMLEARAKGKTTDALKALRNLAPQKAVVWRDKKEETIPAEELKKGDIFVVRPGESIPADGVVTEGMSAVNEASLTGESVPVDKVVGDLVSAATINQSGYLRCEALNVGEDTSLSRIIRMVSEAAATKAPIAKVADKVSFVFVPAVVAAALVTFFVWMLCGGSFSQSLTRAVAVLVISCPCALGLATPVAIMVGNGVGAKNGILFKTAVSLEETGKMEIVALDKTGTITKGEPSVTDLYPENEITEKQLLYYALILERKSEHPLSKAVTAYGDRYFLNEELEKMPDIAEFTVHPGCGLSGSLDGKELRAGNPAYLKAYVPISREMEKCAGECAKEGKTPLFFAKENRLLGMIAVADTIKEESAQAVRELQNMGIRVVMLTGDNEKTAKAVGKAAGVDEVIAGVLPDQKEQVIRRLKKMGKTAMVGDGINDAPALTAADMGVAIGAGTDIAMDAAEVVLMKSRLTDVPAAIRLSRATLKNIHENLFWAFLYNVIGIPLAAGAWVPLFHVSLNPMFAAAAMSLSSFCVVTNALRLNFKNIYDAGKDHKRRKRHKRGGKENPEKNHPTAEKTEENKKESEVITMKKTMTIEGMMCGHCEARVKKVLEALPQVESAEVSHEKGTAIVCLKEEVPDEALKDIVEAEDYKVISIG